MKKYLSVVLALGLLVTMAAIVSATPIPTDSDAAIEFVGGFEEGVVDPSTTPGIPPSIVEPTPSPGQPIPTPPPVEPTPTPIFPTPGPEGPEEPPPQYLSTLGLDFHAHDITIVQSELTSNPQIDFHSIRSRNADWDVSTEQHNFGGGSDPDDYRYINRTNGDHDVAGMWVLANGGGWRVDVQLAEFEDIAANATNQGARLLLSAFGPPIIHAGNIPTFNVPQFAQGGIDAGGAEATLVTGGDGMFAGGRNFEGRLRVLENVRDSISLGTDTAELTWIFVPEVATG